MRVLVVDDSAFMRRIISDILATDPQLNVVGTSCNGLDALEAIPKLHPDVITMDVAMPKMDGLTALRHIMTDHPTPVIMLSSLTKEGADITLKALEYGAIDYVLKPSGSISIDLPKVQTELISKVKTAAHAKLLRPKIKPVPPTSISSKTKSVVLIGASTGGPAALESILIALPQEIPPILIVQHMPPTFTKCFADRLAGICKFEVKEAEEGDYIIRNRVLIAQGGYHMTITKEERIHLNTDPPIHAVRPAVDPMMQTAAEVFRSKTLGVILTGMGRDGANGLRAIKQKGGTTIAQDEETSTIFGMPKAAIDEGVADKTLPLQRIPQEIMTQCQK
ncbi:MAG: chemotaxis response regulator protein-glutamate methylesterase [Candidatus Bathyarchaeota archaeon]|jgi:two-component system chemotaxis response regulator CheB|nr:chemotaxis response regulator protein-glutamate methylesterase [Candidatus Bathyarchaeota archaeon]